MIFWGLMMLDEAEDELPLLIERNEWETEHGATVYGIRRWWFLTATAHESGCRGAGLFEHLDFV